MARDPLKGLVDPKMYTHVSTDKDKTVLKHKMGHTVTIAHNVLSPQMQTQLKALAPASQEQNPVKEAKGGEICMDEGGKVPAPATDTSTDNSKNKQVSQGASQSGGVPSDSPIKTGNWAGVWAKGGRISDREVKRQREERADSIGNSVGTTEQFHETGKNTPVGRMQRENRVRDLSQSERPLKGLAEGGEVCNICGNGECKCQPNNPKLAESNKTPPARKMYAEGETVEDTEKRLRQPGYQADSKTVGETIGHALGALFSRGQAPEAPTPTTDTSAPPQQDQSQPQAPTQPDSFTQDTPQPPMAQAQPDQTQAQPQPQAQVQKPQTPATQAPQTQPQSQQPTDNPMQLLQKQEQQAQAMPEGNPKQELMQENANFEHDLANGHITPETYKSLFAKESTLGKIGTLFGLLVGGGGAGLTHQPNAVLGMMDKEIERDLQAQTTSKANAQNFLRINQAQLANTANIGQTNIDTKTKAFALAQANMLQSTYHDLASKVDKMPEGPQKQQALQNLGMIYSKIGDKINNINDQAVGAGAFANMMLGNQQGSSDEQAFQRRTNAMRMMGPQGEMMAKNAEEKHYPGLQGQASRPLSGTDQEKLDSGINFNEKLNRFIDWTKGHSGDLNPSDMNTGRAMAAELQGAYRQATHGGVYKEGEQNFIAKLIDEDPTKFLNKIRVLPQLNALSKENEARMNTTAKNLGFQGYKSPVQQSQSQPDMKSKSGRPVEMSNGMMYYK